MATKTTIAAKSGRRNLSTNIGTAVLCHIHWQTSCIGHIPALRYFEALPSATIQGKTPACQRAVLSAEYYPPQ